MRSLDEVETIAVFEKLLKFVGKNLKHLVDCPSHEGPDPSPSRYCFRLNKNHVFYVSNAHVRRATNISRVRLLSLGTSVGKFTHGGKFHLTIHSLDLAAHACHKVWLKPTSDMSFLYDNHILKSGLARITDNVSAVDGVVVFSMSDLPLGFGIAAKSTQDCRMLDLNAIVVLNQVDIGLYVRKEDDH